MSRLAAQKEWAFLKVPPQLRDFSDERVQTPHVFFPPWQVLHEHQFPVPRPIDQARHCILMEFIDAYPLWVENLVSIHCIPPHGSGSKGVKSTKFLLLANCTLS